MENRLTCIGCGYQVGDPRGHGLSTLCILCMPELSIHPAIFDHEIDVRNLQAFGQINRTEFYFLVDTYLESNNPHHLQK